MSGKPKICLSGFVLSALMFDNCNSQGDQEGFLIGTVTKNVKSEISDQSMCNTQEEVLISIYSSVPCGDFLSFYNASGNIRESDIESHLGERRKSVVGWYRFRRHCPVYPSMRETAVHRNLKSMFARENSLNEDCFVYAVLTASSLQTFATHSYDYAFYAQSRNNAFKPLATCLLNLGDTKNQYRANSVASAYMESTSFNNVLGTPWNFSSCWETEDILQQFHNRLRVQLDNLQEELAASDAVNASLDHEVAELDNEMQNLLSLRESSSPDPTCESEGAADSEVKTVQESVETEEVKPCSSKTPDKKAVCTKRVADTPQRPEAAKRFCLTKYFEQEQDSYFEVFTEPHRSDHHFGRSMISPYSPSSKDRVRVIYRHVPVRVTDKAMSTPTVYHGRAAEIKKSAGVTKEVPVNTVESSLPDASGKTDKAGKSETGDAKVPSCPEDVPSTSGNKENELKYLYNPECSTWEKQASVPYEPGILTPPKEEEISDGIQASRSVVLDHVDLTKRLLNSVLVEQNDKVIQPEVGDIADVSDKADSSQKITPPYIIYASKDLPPVVAIEEVSAIQDISPIPSPPSADTMSKENDQKESELQNESKDKAEGSNSSEEPTVKDTSDVGP